MDVCPACASEIAPTSRFCSSCGEPQEPTSLTATRALDYGSRTEPARKPGSSGPRSTASVARTGTPAPTTGGAWTGGSLSFHDGRFLPGAVVGDRYRIIGLLGRGGMGEVYRADDMKLGQPVALKFLPEKFAADPERLERFYSEVRIARQVSHPHVCRVYDVGEIEGLTYLSMEYVDGEDLASLLRRIGRLPEDKAIEIARQVAAGLAAAHDRGVLHRDLKPGNIMIDGRGHARVTDFGLAVVGEVTGLEVRTGTPQYMAPEQITGREATIKSDIYALGLVLYEIFTGKRAFDAPTLAELTRMHQDTMPSTPSSHVADLDPAVERVILRCLEKDPQDRPASALAVAAALPGGDPLAAALAAGETPSPEMVAAAGKVGALRPVRAAASLVAFVAGLVVVTLLAKAATVLGRAPLPKSPDVLVERARSVIDKAGFAGPVADHAFQLATNQDFLNWARQNDPTALEAASLANYQPPAVWFWYRASPQPLVALRLDGAVRMSDPPESVSGMMRVVLDPLGRLVEFRAVPPQLDEHAPEPGAGFEWTAFFAEAGLDPAAFTPSRPIWTPNAFADARVAWEGRYPTRPDTPIRVEAASYRGRPVWFEVIGPWSRPDRMQPFDLGAGLRAGQALNAILIVGVMIAAIVLARTNLRHGRCDRRGAFRVALFLLVITTLLLLLQANHGPTLAREWQLLQNALGLGLFIAGLAWLLYVALEPIVRRRWPDSIVAWTRLLAGRFRDPLVGRDILIGIALGIVWSIAGDLRFLAPPWFGGGVPPPRAGDLDALIGPGFLLSNLLNYLLSGIVSAMFLLFFLTTGRVLSRNHWTAYPIFFVITTVMTVLFMEQGNPVVNLLSSAVIALLLTWALARFGLLTTIAAQVTASIGIPLTFDVDAWYFRTSIVTMTLLVVVAAYAFWTALGGRLEFHAQTLAD